MKETLRKKRGERQDLKRKYDHTLSQFEKLKESYQMLESDKDVVTLLVVITQGEIRRTRDLEQPARGTTQGSQRKSA